MSLEKVASQPPAVKAQDYMFMLSVERLGYVVFFVPFWQLPE